MWWVISSFFGACAIASFYLGVLADRAGDGGVYLFALIGLFFLIFCIATGLGASKRKNGMSNINDGGTHQPGSSGFAPHWFMMGALILSALVVLATIILRPV